MTIIEVKNLTKHFGQVKAVDGISFNVEKSEIFGFLGPNGAGKTTTIRCLMDFIRPTAGNCFISGLDCQKDSVRIKEKIGYLAGDVKLNDSWTGNDHLRLAKKLNGQSEIIDDLLQKFEFNPKLKIKTLSTGNKQKLGIILALMSKPEVLILDEPTVGLDPLLQNVFYQYLYSFKEKGCTVFMSSHNLAEVEKVCSRVAIIRQGRIAATENVRSLKEKRLYYIDVWFADGYDKADFNFDGVNITKEYREGLKLTVKGDISPILKLLSQHQIKNIEITRATLEDIFLEFY